MTESNSTTETAYKLDEYDPNLYWKRYQPTLLEITNLNMGVYEPVLDIRPGNISGVEPFGGKPYFGYRCPGKLRFSSEPFEYIWDPTLVPSVLLSPICDLTNVTKYTGQLRALFSNETHLGFSVYPNAGIQFNPADNRIYPSGTPVGGLW